MDDEIRKGSKFGFKVFVIGYLTLMILGAILNDNFNLKEKILSILINLAITICFYKIGLKVQRKYLDKKLNSDQK